jgi:hypothetical protein
VSAPTPTLSWGTPTPGPGARAVPATNTPCASEVSFGTGPGQLRPDTVAILGHELLRRVQEVYAEAGVTLPERQIWVAGEAAYDCEELIVSFTGLRETQIPGWDASAQPQSPCQVPLVASFDVSIVRCIPVPNGTRATPPTPEALAIATDLIVTDSYLLMKSGCRFDLWAADVAYVWNQEHPNGPIYQGLGGMGTEASVVAAPPSGGMQASTLTLATVIG